MSIIDKLNKVYRFVVIYGVLRTYFKVVGRSRRLSKANVLILRAGDKDIGLAGCGQFGFSTIGYFISRFSRHRFARCFDLSDSNQQSFGDFYKCCVSASFEDLLADERVKFLYIASNHASHTDYAIAALNAQKIVYVEKPISVTYKQLALLHKAVVDNMGLIYCGYNRPHSQAIKILKNQSVDFNKPVSLSFFVSGHVLDESHWYRDPCEGTRVCGNVGHWLDLTVHLLSWGHLPDKWTIFLVPSNSLQRDDDVIINLISERGDLVNIILTARTEPFEGINESINIQWDNMIAKVDDFRTLQVWQGDKFFRKKFWPKDVGHKNAILQPFKPELRDWKEIELSTLLMLHIKEMVVENVKEMSFSFSDSYKYLEHK